VFAQDTYLSDRHAAISHGPAGFEVRDTDSQHGVFLKIPRGRVVALPPDTVVKAGEQWLECGRKGPGDVAHYSSEGGRPIARYTVVEGTTVVFGREAPATVLDATDRHLSRRHLSLSLESSQLLLRDVGSVNGTFIKVTRPWPLENGDLLWMGTQLLRLVVGDGRVETRTVVQAPATSSTTPRPAEPPPSGAPGEPSVTFGPGKTFPFGKSANLLELAIAKRVRIKYSCQKGDCGECHVLVTSGAAHLDPKTKQEEGTLRGFAHTDPRCRLACLVKVVRGPIVVTLPK
jgi:ferredoxin